MSVIPTFYLSSKKEDPKTNIKLSIKDINEIINIDCDSEMELPLVFNDLKYILKLYLKFNLNDKEPIININYNFIEQEDSLLSFINSMKNKVENIVEEENKKVEELESITKLKNKRLKEVMELEENINKIKVEKDLLLKDKLKYEEDFKIQKYNQKVLYQNEQNTLLKELVNKVLKLEEEIKIRNSFYIDDVDENEHNKLMEEIRTKNEKIEKENEKLKEELESENESESENEETKSDSKENENEETKSDSKENEIIEETKENEKSEIKTKKFDQNKIISYIKKELENINDDEKQLDNLNENDEKLNELKEKYDEKPNFIPKEIREDPNNKALKLEDEIYEHLKLIISDDLNMIYTNLIYVITELMKFVETFNMEGFDKKQFIIDSIKKFLIYQKMNSPETDFILDTVCPELIDILLLVDKRKIIIRKKINCFIPWCA